LRNDSLSIQQPEWAWPDWARTARIAGAYFDPADSDAELEVHLDVLLAQHVSVVLADSPWGQQYAVWVDNDKFRAVQAVIARMVRKAHARGLRVVMYQTGLELLSSGGRNPGLEHPDWAQRSLDGRSVLYDDVTTEQQHWLKRGTWDFWLSPCDGGVPGSFRELSLSRVREMVATGIDGLWVDEVYLQSSVGSHHDLWPSTDPCSTDAFLSATGLRIPATRNWDDPVFRRWVVWRHSQISDFLWAEKEVARAVNPSIVFFNENSDVDSGRSTYVANDPAIYLAYPDMSTGHEVETIDDRMDEGQTGMKNATLDQWLSFRTMVAFARGVDRGKPSWILSYGYEPRDSAQLAGMVLAESGNFYETKGPQMADTVGAIHRTQLFQWITEHEEALYGGESLAHVGLLYSPRTRDLVDTTSGGPYNLSDSIHFAAYRIAANLLYRAHIPFDVVIDTDVAKFQRYQVLIIPEVRAMSDTTAAEIRRFDGRLITIGSSGHYDEWLALRSTDALADLAQRHFTTVDPDIAVSANTGLLATQAPAELQFGLRSNPTGYSLVLVNTAYSRAPAFQVSLHLPEGLVVVGAHLTSLGGGEDEVSFSHLLRSSVVRLDLPAGIDMVALLTLITKHD
jgi:hypothetical protein